MTWYLLSTWELFTIRQVERFLDIRSRVHWVNCTTVRVSYLTAQSRSRISETLEMAKRWLACVGYINDRQASLSVMEVPNHLVQIHFSAHRRFGSCSPTSLTPTTPGFLHSLLFCAVRQDGYDTTEDTARNGHA